MEALTPDASNGALRGLGMVLKRAEQTMLRAKSEALKPVGITLAQYVALAELHESPGVTAAALARACLVTPQAMMVALKSMQEQGLLDRRAHARHRNILEIFLTDVGHEILTAARERVVPIEQRVTEALSGDELTTLATLLTRYTEAIASGAA